MRKYVNGEYIEMTAEEISAMQREAEQAEREYWENISYEDGVHSEFRKMHSQQDVEARVNNYLSDPTNPLFIQEMKEMQEDREYCKVFVKEKKGM